MPAQNRPSAHERVQFLTHSQPARNEMGINHCRETDEREQLPQYSDCDGEADVWIDTIMYVPSSIGET